jgi:branched-chain amino acid transport system ATP-binding protein
MMATAATMAASSPPKLRLEGITRRFGGLTAVRDVSLDLYQGELLGLIGPNGSGKSTLISMISGRLAPSKGRLTLNGEDITRSRAAACCRAGIAATFQMVHVPDILTAIDNVAVAAMYGRRKLDVDPARRLARDLLHQVQFTAPLTALPQNLTYFDQKRIELARALATDPEVLLLDEWLAGLTPTELNEGIALIRSLHTDKNLTIVLTEHVMAAIRELCDRVVVLSAGEIVATGTADECLSNPDVITVYLGDEDV